MKCLVVADTFPNRYDPWRGPYNRRQIELLSGMCAVKVVNPLPWTQLLTSLRAWGLLGRNDPVIAGAPTMHPVFWYLPVVGRGSNWRGVYRSVRGVECRKDSPWCDVILATFAYPEGAAALRLGQQLGVPYAVKVRGSDLHSLPESGKRRQMTAEAVRGADAVVAVSKSLASIAVDLGAEPAKVHVLSNGVDCSSFRIVPRDEARWSLGIPLARKTVVFVGSLLSVKGCDVLMAALEKMHARKAPSALEPLTVLVGDGPMWASLQKRVDRAGLQSSVVFVGKAGREDVALWLNAADALVLPSRNEGCPNVVLEALACGTPVVASRVGAIPELVDDSSGVIVPPGDEGALAQGISTALRRDWDRGAIRNRVVGMSWEHNAERLCTILEEVAGHGKKAEPSSQPLRKSG